MPRSIKGGSQNQVLPSPPSKIGLNDNGSSKGAVTSIKVERMSSNGSDSGYSSGEDSLFISERSVRDYDTGNTTGSDTEIESAQDDIPELSDFSDGNIEDPKGDSQEADEPHSSPVSKKTYRIKPDIEKTIPEPALSLLREKVENQNYRNPYYVEEVSDSPYDRVLEEAPVFEEPLLAESLSYESDEMSLVSLSSSDGDEVSVTGAVPKGALSF